MSIDPVDLIATPTGVLAWYRCEACGSVQQRDRRPPPGACCDECQVPLHVSGRFDYGRPWARVTAIAIDAAVLLFPFLLLGGNYMFGAATATDDASADRGQIRLVVALALFAVLLAYQFAGASPGKLAMGLRVVDAETWRRPGIVTAILRTGAIFVTSATFGVGYAVMLQDEERRTLHDRIAGTRVIER